MSRSCFISSSAVSIYLAKVYHTAVPQVSLNYPLATTHRTSHRATITSKIITTKCPPARPETGSVGSLYTAACLVAGAVAAAVAIPVSPIPAPHPRSLPPPHRPCHHSQPPTTPTHLGLRLRLVALAKREAGAMLQPAGSPLAQPPQPTTWRSHCSNPRSWGCRIATAAAAAYADAAASAD